nr:hypothetical protein [Tardiphaga robiniae]
MVVLIAAAAGQRTCNTVHGRGGIHHAGHGKPLLPLKILNSGIGLWPEITGATSQWQNATAKERKTFLESALKELRMGTRWSFEPRLMARYQVQAKIRARHAEQKAVLWEPRGPCYLAPMVEVFQIILLMSIVGMLIAALVKWISGIRHRRYHSRLNQTPKPDED